MKRTFRSWSSCLQDLLRSLIKWIETVKKKTEVILTYILPKVKIILTTIKRMSLIRIAKSNKNFSKKTEATLTKNFNPEADQIYLSKISKISKERKHLTSREDQNSSFNTIILILKVEKWTKQMAIYVMKNLTFFKGQKGQIYKDEKEINKRTKIDIAVLIKGSIKTMIKEIFIRLVSIKILEMSKNQTKIILIRISFIKNQELALVGVKETFLTINTINNVLNSLIHIQA